MKSTIAILSLLAVGSHAFAPSLPRVHPRTACNLVMTEAEITAILDQAHECAEGECAVDDVEDLIAELRTQQKVLSERLDTIMNAVAHLQTANESSDRKTGELLWEFLLRAPFARFWIGTERSKTFFADLLEKNVYPADDVRALIKDVMRVFSTEKGQYANAFSGDIGSGAQTAYDVLPPKPWKAAP
ncbi:hypothetical protein THAOC_27807 [Thalassiosira oceanica]|uniref:RxLR effector protein n=1 Tax=Thalassiosira oceanica TaxID=159749 RepID=K0RKN2_THAOC|nr:hypothetical protein THAOC_27807 [Thalassiosira oceanica]|eukprot:EJK52869.1 hypothetical protein THAOC_27807 [Thalassiosira oceanica]